MLRRLFTFASALSLLLFIATAVLWAWGYFREPSMSRHVRGVWYTALSEDGYLVLTRPPANRASAELTELAGRISNDQIEWFTRGRSDPSPHPQPDTATQQLCDVVQPVHARRNHHTAEPAPQLPVGPLLDALDDPGRFLAAHVVLMYLTDADGTEDPSFSWTRWGVDGSGGYAGLIVRLTASELPRLPVFRDTLVEYRAQIDPAQFPAVRERWHRKLDERVLALAFWKPAAALLVLPLLWALFTGYWLIRTDASTTTRTSDDRMDTGGRGIRRLARLPFLTCAAISLMVAGGIIYLWATSYPQRYGIWRYETIGADDWSHDEMAWAIDRGTFQYSREIQEPPKPESALTQREQAYLSSHRRLMWDGPRETVHPGLKLTFTVGGFLLWTTPAKEGQDGRLYKRYVIVPLWFPLTLSLLLPVRAIPVVWRMWRGWAARPHRKRGFVPVLPGPASPPSG